MLCIQCIYIQSYHYVMDQWCNVTSSQKWLRYRLYLTLYLSPLTNPPPGIVPLTQSTNTSTPTTCQMSPNATAHLTPLLNETSSSTSSINSPMAIATAPGVNSPNSVAAILSTLQQLQQAGNHSSLLPSSSPLKTSQILNSPPTTSVFSSHSTAQLRCGTAPSPSSKMSCFLLKINV